VYYHPTLGAECLGAGEHIHPARCERKAEKQRGASTSSSTAVRDGTSSNAKPNREWRSGKKERTKQDGRNSREGDKEGNSRCDMLDENRGKD
jgi:hypothetical protein